MSPSYIARMHGAGGRRGWIMASVMAVLALVVVGGWQVAKRNADVAKAREWTPAGAPCPAISRADYLASGFSAASRVDFDGVGFARASGYIVCSDIVDDGGHGGGEIQVCQFNDPSALDVTTTQGHTYYLPRSKPATVTVSHGRASCVLAANQHMEIPGG